MYTFESAKLVTFTEYCVEITVLLLQMPSIKLQSSDGEIFEVDVEIAKQSVTIKTMLEGKSMKPCGSLARAEIAVCSRKPLEQEL